MWYDGNIPAEFESALERRIGGHFAAEIVYDPPGSNITFTEKYSCVQISPVSIIKDVDPSGSVVPTLQVITFKFNDPDEYFSVENPNSFLYGIDPVGKEIVCSLINLTEPTVNRIPIFAGRIDRLPILETGYSSIQCSDRRKLILNKVIRTPDTSAAKKLMIMNAAGGMIDSITYDDNWNSPPFEFELTDGSLPTGLTLAEDGEISGTPTAAGESSFVVTCRNADGIEKELDCSLTIDDTPINEHFTSAGGLGDYTSVDKGTTFSLAAEESWLRMTMNGNYEWDADSDDAPHLYLTGADLAGDWVLYGKVKNGFDGQNANYSGLYFRLGTYDGFICGIKSTGVAGALKAQIYRVYDSNAIYSADIAVTSAWFKIKKVSTTYYFYYRLADSGSWTLLNNYTRAGTVSQVGFMTMCDVTGNGYGQVDQMYFKTGTLAFSTDSALPTGAVGLAYSTTMVPSGGAGEYTFAVTSGILPTGLSLDSATGIISGTPTVDKSVNFEITVTDGAGSTFAQTFNITIEAELFFYPARLPNGTVDVAYSESFTTYGDGTLDRTEITVSTDCGLGQWEIEFLDNENYVVNGAGVKDASGNINDDFSEGGITIPATAWAGHFMEGNIIKFVTGVSYESQNAVKTIYELYILSGVEAKFLDASSYFGDVELGTLWGGASAGATTIKIKTEVPALIKAGETLTITEGETTEEVAIENPLLVEFESKYELGEETDAFSSIAYIGNGICIAGKRAYATYGGYAFYRSTDYGETWAPIANPIGISGNNIYGLATDGAGMILAGTGDNGGEMILRSTDWGETWSIVVTHAQVHTLAGTSSVTSVFSFVNTSANTWLACLKNTKSPDAESKIFILKSINNGAAWAALSTTGLLASGRSMQRMSDGNIILAGVFSNTGSNRGIYVSTDGGATWVKKEASIYPFSGICEAGAGIYLLGTMDTGSSPQTISIYRTVDSGSNWTKVFDASVLGGYAYFRSIIKINDDQILAFASGSELDWSYRPANVYFSNDAGETWYDGGEVFENAFGNMNAVYECSLIEDNVFIAGCQPDSTILKTSLANLSARMFPPFLDIRNTVLLNSYTEQAVVTWKQRDETDDDYTFDEFYNFCDNSAFFPSFTFEREMTYLQAIELVCQHAGIYSAQSLGKERMAGFISRATETPHVIATSEIINDSVNIEHLEPITAIEVEYGYDYIEREFLKTLYNENGAGGQYKKLSLPGYYGESQVQAIIDNLFAAYNAGLKLINVKLDLRGISCCIGERIDILNLHPSISAKLEIYGIVYDYNSQTIALKTIKRNHLNGD